MALDQTAIYNMALSAVGHKARVSIPTEVSRGAEICHLWYEKIRDTILRAAPWPSTRKMTTLSVLAERDFTLDWAVGDPDDPWTYAYAVPSDYLYPRNMIDYSRFEMGRYDIHKAILSNYEDAVFSYTSKETSISLWDQGLQDSVIFGLAAAIAMPLTGKPQRAKDMLEKANSTILEARAMALNEQNNAPEWDAIPDWLAVRGVSPQTMYSRYIYPNGPLLALPSVVNA